MKRKYEILREDADTGTEEFANDSGFRSDKEPDYVEPTGNLAPGETAPEDDTGGSNDLPNSDEPASEDGGQPTVALDAASMQALKDAAANQAEPVVAEPAPTLTADQVNQLTKAHLVSAEDAAFFLNKDIEDVTDEDVTRLQVHTDKTRDNAIAISEIASNMQLQQIMEVINPLVEQHKAQQKNDTYNRFYNQFPGLEQFEPLVQQMAGTLKDFQGTEEQAFKQVADLVVKTGADMNVTIDPTQKTNSKQTNQDAPTRKAVPSMKATAGGGRSQASGEDTSVGANHTFKNPWTGKPYNPNPNITE